ncbi:hypothetical protein JOB18_010387 [Solea senegalensis]|uniref:Uncharacterized protein n=1 Tax=Solea senegalensis TaxID=28829 RepID=A0AAV6QRL2_SOLSE|nr:hypothetical protein JOB18_010387 [Solea senegalensis]
MSHIIGSCLYHKHFSYLQAKSTSGTKLIKHSEEQKLQAKTTLIRTKLCRKVFTRTQVSQTQCHNGDLGTAAPVPCGETLEHLEDPSVSGWQPGWEKMSDLSDTQMCGLLAVQVYEAGITH